MRRMAAVMLMAMGALLLGALPAHAKGVTSATFNGPGLPPGGITFRTDGGNGEAGPRGSALMEGMAGVFEEFKADAPSFPKSDLGPRYEATIAFDFAPRPLRAILYPYARGGPAMFIPAGQKLGPEFEVPTLSGGWTATNTTFLDTLIALGFPKQAPGTVVAPPATRAVAPEPASSPWPWLAPVLILGTLGLIGGLVLRGTRLRRARVYS